MVRFFVAGDVDFCVENRATYVELSEDDCTDLLRWLGLDGATYGFVTVGELAARCRRRLWPMARNYDPALHERRKVDSNGSVRMEARNRPAGFLRSYTEALLRLTQRATPNGQILYS